MKKLPRIRSAFALFLFAASAPAAAHAQSGDDARRSQVIVSGTDIKITVGDVEDAIAQQSPFMRVRYRDPAKLAELQQRFLIEGAKYQVLPLDDRQRERFDPKIAGRPDLMAGRTTMTLRPGMTRLNENTVLNVKNTSFTVTATLTLPDQPAEGAVIAQGGRFGGWALYFRKGVPTYAHNYVGMHTYVVDAGRPLGPGPHVVQMRFDYDGGGAGRGGEVRFTCDDEELGSGRVDQTVPALFSFDEGLDIGLDSLDPVVSDYATPKGRFTGVIDTVVIDIAPEAHHDADLVTRALYRRH